MKLCFGPLEKHLPFVDEESKKGRLSFPAQLFWRPHHACWEGAQFVQPWRKLEGLRRLPWDKVVYFVGFSFSFVGILFEKSVTSGDPMLENQTNVEKKMPYWEKLFVGPEAQGHSHEFAIQFAVFSRSFASCSEKPASIGASCLKMVYWD